MEPLTNDPIMWGRSIWSFRHLKHQNLSTGYDFIQSRGIIFSVPFLATREAVGLLTNDTIMSGRSMQWFRHLEHQNLSNFEPCNSWNGWYIFVVPFWTSKELVAPLANDPILLGRYCHLDTSNTKICLLVMIYPKYWKNNFLVSFSPTSGSGATCKFS